MMQTNSELEQSMESRIAEYIRNELVNEPGNLTIEPDTSLLEPHIIDSLSLLKLVLFLEKEFAITVGQDELLPQNFSTIESICAYLHNKTGK